MALTRKHVSLLTATLFLIQISAAAPLTVELQKLFGATVGNDTTVTSSSVRYYETPQGFSVFGGGDGIIQPGEQVTAEVTTGVECSTDVCVIDFWIKTETGTYFDSDNPHFVSSGDQVTADISFEAPSQTGSYLGYWYSGIEEYPDQGQLFDSESYIVEKDSDGDGITDRNDDCPNEDGQETYNGCPPPDTDGDGVPDDEDECPLKNGDDGAGVGIKENGCPYQDEDGDGIQDENDLCDLTPGPEATDGCPDRDSDNFRDSVDEYPDDPNCHLDDDNDGVCNSEDAFPDDSSETRDSDGDGVGDNSDEFPQDSECTTDSDGDGVCDSKDAFPNDSTETADSDGDGTGDNADQFPNDASCVQDTDGDSVCNSQDAFPSASGKTADSDGDQVADSTDQCLSRAGLEQFTGCPDNDGDGVPVNKDQCKDTRSNISGDAVDSTGCPVPVEEPKQPGSGDNRTEPGPGDGSDDKIGTGFDRQVFSMLQNLWTSINTVIT